MIVEIRLLPPDKIPEFWTEIYPHITAAMEHSRGEFTIQDVMDNTSQNLWQVWITVNADRRIDGAGLTCLSPFPNALACEIISFGSTNTNRDWLPLIHDIEKWAVEQECDRVIFQGRSGWEKVMTPLGYSKWHVTVGKML